MKAEAMSVSCSDTEWGQHSVCCVTEYASFPALTHRPAVKSFPLLVENSLEQLSNFNVRYKKNCLDSFFFFLMHILGPQAEILCLRNVGIGI